MAILEKRRFYFRGFPTIDYNLDGTTREVLDFIHRWKIRDSVKDNAAGYSKWIVRDADTLFGIAKTLYGSQHYYWVIMMMNDMLDPIFDWPLNEKYLKNNIISIYGAENIYSHHHWEAEEDDDLFSVPVGTIVSIDYPFNKISISNFNYESSLNEAKRKIKLLKPEYLDQIRNEREKILSSNFGKI